MNEELLYRLRPAPSPEFVARLKKKLDRQAETKASNRHRIFIRSLIGALLVGGTALAVTSLSDRGMIDAVRDLFSRPAEQSTAQSVSTTNIPSAGRRPNGVVESLSQSVAAHSELPANANQSSTQRNPLLGVSSTVQSEQVVHDARAPQASNHAAVTTPASVPTMYAISGAGSPYPSPIYSNWSAAYQRKSGVFVMYSPAGSAAGIRQLKMREVLFVAIDKPMTPADLEKLDLAQFPTLLTGVVPFVNLSTIQSGELVLDGKTLAGIYRGEIRRWSDPRIAALNPRIALPDWPISPVYRSDSGGAAFVFNQYLSKYDADFEKLTPPAAAGPAIHGVGVKSDEGVAIAVRRTEGAIGYVDYSYAERKELVYARLVNADGNVVSPTLDTVQAAAENADWSAPVGLTLSLTDQPGKHSWPLTGASYVLLRAHEVDTFGTAQVLRFFDWSFTNGGPKAAELDYVPLPKDVIAVIRSRLRIEFRRHLATPDWQSPR